MGARGWLLSVAVAVLALVYGLPRWRGRPAVATELLLFTPEELRAYDGSDASKPILLAVFGRVFDVTAGARHYGPGGAYHGFAGRDGSRAFWSGIFTDEGLVDDLSDLTAGQIADIAAYAALFERKYVEVGRVVGPYYDAAGRPTSLSSEWLPHVLGEAADRQALEAAERKTFPGCNTRWSQAEGGWAWCSAADRVPRRMHSALLGERCVCVESAAAADAPDRFKLIDGCDAAAQRCRTLPPG